MLDLKDQELDWLATHLGHLLHNYTASVMYRELFYGYSVLDYHYIAADMFCRAEHQYYIIIHYYTTSLLFCYL